MITPQLWNSDVTKCLSSLNQLTDMTNCLSVSDEVIACVIYQTASNYHVIFFNVSTKKIENEMSITKNTPEKSTNELFNKICRMFSCVPLAFNVNKQLCYFFRNICLKDIQS